MTDLTNDASFNLDTGASGGQGYTANGAAGQGSAAQSKAEEIAATAARQVEDRAYQVRDWALTQSDTVRTTVLDKPFISVGTAFAAGIIFGMLLRR
jgi:ElaB/YqjD/DUF883 family membrane-anchored ribosome-binding protein